jgi:hypothetical protein
MVSQIFGDKFEAKIPSSLIQMSIKDIFFKLLKEQPTGVYLLIYIYIR